MKGNNVLAVLFNQPIRRMGLHSIWLKLWQRTNLDTNKTKLSIMALLLFTDKFIVSVNMYPNTYAWLGGRVDFKDKLISSTYL